jgi:hypothetical protein
MKGYPKNDPANPRTFRPCRISELLPALLNHLQPKVK